MAVFEYYPDQLRAFAALCEMLNEFEGKTTDSSIFIKGPIEVCDGNDPDVPLGHLVDEIGGAWSFKPVESGVVTAAAVGEDQ